jgi:phage FluMu protein Com
MTQVPAPGTFLGEEIRCPECDRMAGKIQGRATLEIVCSKCKETYIFKTRT